MDCEWIGWCALKPEAQAAWIQAVGSILAIAVALGVPAWQKRKEVKSKEEDQRQRAINTAGALQPFVDAYRRRAQMLKECLEEKQSVDQLKRIFPIDAFDLAPTVQQFHPTFHLMGTAGSVANMFVSSLFWLQQAMHVIQKESLRDETRLQILQDCENTIALAQELAPLLIALCGKTNRLPDQDMESH